MAIQVDETTVTTSVVGYTIDSGVALPTSIAAIHSEPALEMSLELYLGSGEIQSLGESPWRSMSSSRSCRVRSVLEPSLSLLAPRPMY